MYVDRNRILYLTIMLIGTECSSTRNIVRSGKPVCSMILETEQQLITNIFLDVTRIVALESHITRKILIFLLRKVINNKNLRLLCLKTNVFSTYVVAFGVKKK